MRGKGLHKAQIERLRRLAPKPLRQHIAACIVHADIEHGARPAPFGVFRAATHRHQKIVAEHRHQFCGVGQLPGGDRAHAVA
jgi:hypothetical protein